MDLGPTGQLSVGTDGFRGAIDELCVLSNHLIDRNGRLSEASGRFIVTSKSALWERPIGSAP